MMAGSAETISTTALAGERDDPRRRVSEPESSESAAGAVPYEEQPQTVMAAARQVGRPIFFSLAIIIVSFVPVFLLQAHCVSSLRSTGCSARSDAAPRAPAARVERRGARRE